MKKSLAFILIALFLFCLGACNNQSSKYVEATSITLNVSRVKVQVKETYQLQATINPSNATNKNIKWTSSNVRVARVFNGKIIAIESGNAIITASLEHGNCIAECVVIVTPYDPKSTTTLEYRLNKDEKSYSVTGVWTCNDELIIPSIYNDLPVTSIDAFAFCDNIILKKIIIPDSVTSIGYGAFLDCQNLTSVTLPSEITTIEEDLFYGCSSLASIVIPKKVTSIGAGAFNKCTSLTSIAFEDTASWYMVSDYNNWPNKTNGSEIVVTDPLKNAGDFQNLHSKYLYKL